MFRDVFEKFYPAYGENRRVYTKDALLREMRDSGLIGRGLLGRIKLGLILRGSMVSAPSDIFPITGLTFNRVGKSEDFEVSLCYDDGMI